MTDSLPLVVLVSGRGSNLRAIDARIEADARRRVDEATERCKAAPRPPLEILTTDVYADGGFAWRN